MVKGKSRWTLFWILCERWKSKSRDHGRKKDDGEKFVKLKRIVSYYTADFYPCSQNKDKSLDCSDIGKFSRNEERKETLIVDTETTGIYPDVDELLQVSIINQNGSVLFNEYFKPQNHIQWKDAEAINHITPEMVANCPCINERISALQAIFDSAKTIIGYNIDFDINFLLAVGIKIKSVRYIDVMRAFAPIYHIWDEKSKTGNSRSSLYVQIIMVMTGVIQRHIMHLEIVMRLCFVIIKCLKSNPI